MTGRRPHPGEEGFTLVELIVSVAILGTIAFALTQSVVLALRTTQDISSRVSGAAAVHTLGSYFTRDVQSAEEVATVDEHCVPGDPGVFLHLRWTEAAGTGGNGATRTVSYALEPPAAREQHLVRWSCSTGQDPDRKVLGLFSNEGPGIAVSASCDGRRCGSSTDPPATVSLSVRGDPSAPASVLTVRRRTA